MNLQEKKKEEILLKLLENKVKHEFSSKNTQISSLEDDLPLKRKPLRRRRAYTWMFGMAGVAILALGLHTGNKFYQIDILAKKQEEQLEQLEKKERQIIRQSNLLDELEAKADSLEKLLRADYPSMSEEYGDIQDLQAELSNEQNKRVISEQKIQYYEKKLAAYEELLIRKDELISKYKGVEENIIEESFAKNSSGSQEK